MLCVGQRCMLICFLTSASNRVKGRIDKEKCSPGELFNIIGYPLPECYCTVRGDAVLVLLGDLMKDELISRI